MYISLTQNLQLLSKPVSTEWSAQILTNILFNQYV